MLLACDLVPIGEKEVSVLVASKSGDGPQQMKGCG